MNNSAKKRHHEEARKKHKHEIQEHAREAAKQRPSRLPQIVLVVGVVLIIAFVVFAVIS
ncbi:hypothetical protein GobsT_33750 [Gemmata obscuriglobus]|uniref:hypothetical protein n=1 Tax=Gemmata obscuriglobus TaxID=114 RepID=UPI00016C54A0|nr:hypothetical protein [Gemmata obscuriglobus]QEG28592.1 hypothetical protein GobsT_33750 [Gemmata obscuriglobus]VTS06738.1 unnamed protein product [Gemmata obscuriglobus UQM 2246]